MKQHTGGVWTGFLALCGLVVSCDNSQNNRATAVVRDSAGVAIAENHMLGLWGDTPQWVVVDSPVVQIGVIEGDSVYELSLALSATRLANGHIVVGNRGSSELRVYDREGRHIRSIGRDGEGPGEFKTILGLWRYRADSLLVYDRSLRRVSVFDDTPSFGRSFVLRSAGDGLGPSIAGVLPDGSLIVVGSASVTPALGPGIHRRSGQVLRYGSSGIVDDTIAVVLGEEWVGIEGVDGVLLTARPFMRNSYIGSADNSVVVADGERFEILLYSSEGNLIRRIRRSGSNRVITADDLARYEQSRVEAAGSAEAANRTREILRRIPMPETYPAFVSMIVDTDKNIWLEVPRAAGELDRWYSVVTANGQLLGRVVMPNGIRPLEIGSDYVLGRFVDELGVEYIHVHSMEKRD